MKRYVTFYMRPCFAVEVITPKKYKLGGLWFGPARPKQVIIFTHGLASSALNQHPLVEPWVDKNTAVITFSNRGHDKITKLRRVANTKKGYTSILAGEAHEVFTDCVDDIQGVIDFAKQQGVKEIYLAGHSTGCQKSVYYASKGADKAVKGLILLAPMSDYAATVMLEGEAKLAKATKTARAMVKVGKKHELLPHAIWNDVVDAQRFLSLYTPDSVEEIFSYAQPKKNPSALKKVQLPMLVILGENDEFGDRPVKDIAAWFEKHVNSNSKVQILPDVLHGFFGGEKKAAKMVSDWLK